MSNTKKSAPSVSKEIRSELDALSQTASKIRFLHSKGFSRGDISRILSIRYQWVRNVLITPLKNG
jgi:hypothetical protein